MLNNQPETRTFQLGIDTDSSLSAVEQGFSRMLENCLIENGVDITNIKGNLRAEFQTEFTFFKDNPLNIYKCLGSKYDPIKEKVYFFVWSQDQNTSAVTWSFIFEYDIQSNVVYVVCDEYWSDVLDFNENELITAISIVHIDEFRPLLYWSQEAGLRKINIYKAKQTYAQTGGYADITLETIDRIKYPPTYAPTIRQITDTTFTGNNIQKGFFQFSVRNQYDDYEASAPSDWSRVNIPYFPYGEENNDVSLFNIGQRDNCILVTLKKPFSTVSKLDLLVREKTSDVGTEINYDWRIYDTLNVGDITWDDNDEYVYKFYNDKTGKLITQEEANKIFDNVPLQAKADTFAEDSRIYDGNVTEGFDLEPIDITVSASEYTFASQAQADQTNLFAYKTISGDVRGTIELPVSSPFTLGGTISWQFHSTDVAEGRYNFEYVIQESDLIGYPTTLVTNIFAAWNDFNPVPDYFILNTDGTHTIYMDNGYVPVPPYDDNDIVFAAFTPDLANCVPQFKNRHSHYFGVYYSDGGGRRTSVQKLDKVYFDADLEKVIKARFEINNVPPLWATHYNLCYAGYDGGNLYQIKLLNLGSPDSNNYYTITVNWLNSQYRYREVTFLKYEYSVGDRIKFLYGDNSGELTNHGLDFSVVGKGANEGEIIIEGNNQLSLLSADTNFLIEIYKKSTFNELYHTIYKGEIKEAGTTSRYHAGNIQDQDYLPSALPAITEVEGVNMYIRPRYYTYLSSANEFDFYNILTEISTRVHTYGNLLFNIILHIYNDPARGSGDEVMRCVFDASMSLSDVYNNNLIVKGLNTTANWGSYNPNYRDTFFTDNYQTNYLSSIDKLYINQISEFPVLYFKISASAASPSWSYDETDTYTTTPDADLSQILYIEDPNQSDIFVGKSTGDGGSVSGSAVTSFGKPNIVNDNFRQVVRENTIWYSGQLIPESNINGLSSYPDGQFKDYSQAFGSIQKLFSTDRMLKVFMELRCGFLPIQQYLTGGDGANLVLNNSQVLTQMQYYEGLYGLGTHSESHVHFGFADYFVDPNNGAVCRLSNDGLTVISDVKNGQGNYLVRNYLYNLIKKNTGNFVATFNQRRNSYEVNIGGCVVVWDEQKNNWIGTRSYNGEMFGTAGVDMISFQNGRLYLHEANQVYNNFYGRQYTSKIKVVGNEGLGMKIYKAIRTRSTSAWSAPFIANNLGQRSMLDKQNFQYREGKWWAAFKMDMNTPNVPYPIIEGRVLRDIAILVQLENDNIEREVLKYVEILQIPSK